MQKLKRSQRKIFTREAKVLRYMRMTKKVSTRAAGKAAGVSYSAIAHYEQGRMTISPERLHQLVQAYGYTLDDFYRLMESKELPMIDVRDSCHQMLDRLSEMELRAVYGVLTGFTARAVAEFK